MVAGWGKFFRGGGSGPTRLDGHHLFPYEQVRVPPGPQIDFCQFFLKGSSEFRNPQEPTTTCGSHVPRHSTTLCYLGCFVAPRGPQINLTSSSTCQPGCSSLLFSSPLVSSSPRLLFSPFPLPPRDPESTYLPGRFARAGVLTWSSGGWRRGAGPEGRLDGADHPRARADPRQPAATAQVSVRSQLKR